MAATAEVEAASGDRRHLSAGVYIFASHRRFGRTARTFRPGGANSGATSTPECAAAALSATPWTPPPPHASAEHCGRYPNAAVPRGVRSESLIRFVTDRPGHDRRYAIDCSKIEREFGFCPRVRLEAGLRATIAWYLAKPHVLATGWQRTQSEP